MDHKIEATYHSLSSFQCGIWTMNPFTDHLVLKVEPLDLSIISAVEAAAALDPGPCGNGPASGTWRASGDAFNE